MSQDNRKIRRCRLPNSSRSSRTGTPSKESAPRLICTRHTSCGTICGRSTTRPGKERRRFRWRTGQAVPLIHPDGKKLYCGGQWHSLNVYDTENLKHLTDVELGHSMAASGMRFVKSDKDL